MTLADHAFWFRVRLGLGYDTRRASKLLSGRVGANASTHGAQAQGMTAPARPLNRREAA